MSLRKRIRVGAAMSWPDDEGSMDGTTEAEDMSVPPQCSFLIGDVEPVGEVVVGQDGALGDHWHTVGPAVQLLLHSVPATENTKQKIQEMEL